MYKRENKIFNHSKFTIMQETKKLQPTAETTMEAVKIHEVADTPFTIVETKRTTETKDSETTETIEEHETKEFIICCGNSIVDPTRFDNKEKAREYIDSKPYDLIFNVCYIIAKQMSLKYGEN